MDLLAVVTHEERVEVHRLNGQRAFGLQRKSQGVKVESLCWKYNGQYLAVSWSDETVDVISAETGNSLQNFRQVTNASEDKEPNQSQVCRTVTCLGWGLSLVDVEAAKSRTKRSNGERFKESDPMAKETAAFSKPLVTLDDFLDRDPDLDTIDIPLELPDQLAQFDVTDLMPKLPTLPGLPASAYKTGQHTSAELFASQISLDAALHRGTTHELNALNSFLLSDSRGSVRLVFYDSLSIGSVCLPNDWNFEHINHLKHASHPFAHSHVLLSQVCIDSENSKLVLTPLSLRFLKSAGRNIHFIDFKTAQLSTLLQYVGESILALHHHWKHALDLPTRFQRNISETLDEMEEPRLAQSLYQLAATGYCSATIKEWLTDELTERGHKRWDHSVSQGYTKVLEITQENLLPALDRCNVILSNLQGLAQYHEHSPAFDVPASAFSLILDIIRCIRLLGHHILLFASEEHRRFLAFSKWLRYAIDFQAADPTSATGLELIERDPGLDSALVLTYIRGGLEHSKIDGLLSAPADAPEIHANSDMYIDLTKGLDAFKNNKPCKGDILKLSSYYTEWCKRNQTLVDHITSWQRVNTLMPGGLVLVDSNISRCDLRMVFEDLKDITNMTSYAVAVKTHALSEIVMYRVVHSDIFDDVSKSVQICEALVIDFTEAEVKDLRFTDDTSLMVLLKKDDVSYLIALPYRPSSPMPLPGMVYQRLGPPLATMQMPEGMAGMTKISCQVGDLQVLEKCIRHTFVPDEGFDPIGIEINGRKGRRTCAVLGEDYRKLKVFDLDYTEDEARESSQAEALLNTERMADHIMTG